jgi:multiple antibiotic resistance protein
MVLMTQATSTARLAVDFASVTLVLLISWVVLAGAPRLMAFVGQTGLNVMTRIMGLLVTVIGVQFIVNGATPILEEILRRAGR